MVGGEEGDCGCREVTEDGIDDEKSLSFDEYNESPSNDVGGVFGAIESFDFSELDGE